MKKLITILLFFSIFSFNCEQKTQTFYVQIEQTGSARLMDRPDAFKGIELDRIPINEKLKVLDSQIEKAKPYDVTWFKVEYNGKTGWISHFTTTGKMLKEKKYVITEEQGMVPLRDKIGQGHKTLRYIPGHIKLELLKSIPDSSGVLGKFLWYKVKDESVIGYILSLETTGEVLIEIN